MSTLASAISPAYSNSFGRFDPACSGAVWRYSGARRGVTTSDASRSNLLGGVHAA